MSTQSRLFLPLEGKALAFPLNDPARVFSAAALETAIEAKTHSGGSSSVTFKYALAFLKPANWTEGIGEGGHPK